MKGESYFNHICCSSQADPVQDVRQPGVKIRRFSAPGRFIELRRFEASKRLLVVLRRRGGGSGTMEAWEARISDAVSQAESKAESKAEQSYMQKSTFDSIDF